ncbi:MAG: primosomal protein N' [Alphaproteobacteria bacterium]|nr:primosomal protein N' [Alphaproteobacteria bacterium]MBL7099706.1 primosomal protein N' [Alphaproteobacteria bacterium]
MKTATLRPSAGTSAGDLLFEPAPRAGVLLPLALAGAYDYKLPKGTNASRGLLVSTPLGPRDYLGVVWGAAEGAVGDNRLKEATPLEGFPALPSNLCDFVDWVAQYTLSPPGMILSMVLRSARAFDPPVLRVAYARSGVTPARVTPARERALAVADDGLARSVPGLAQEANVSSGVVRGLIECGALAETTLPEFAAFPQPDAESAAAELNAAQRAAADALIADVRAQKFAVALLDGVTGSGKTEVYFEAVAEALRRGKQVLILLPEIALTVQFLERFAARFGCRPAEWHSDLSAKERTRTYRAVMSGEAQVVVGARSSLFLPYRELGLIVVDEEHEQAYKQEDGIIYHARDMAVVRARSEKCPIVLASATPSLESYVNAVSGRYAHLKLPRRHGAAVLPETRLVDLRHEKVEAGTWLSQPLRDAIAATLAAGEQAMLFLNRRGYAPMTLCQSCGHKMTCRDCSSWLVEHRYRKRLMCHQCGYETGLPTKCPACEAEGTLIACGPGVERVAEEFAAVFPDARVAIASSDTMHGPQETQAAIRAMAKHEIDVLIGTQIVAKGHHFPQLTLVGVIDADLGGSDGDLRARERTFQLLHQVAGRAGRAEKPGLVLMQTRNPGDMVMKALASGDRDSFYEQERQYRERAAAPPFGRLAAVIVSGADSEAVVEAGKMLAKAAPAAKGVKIWGPTPAFYHLLRGMTRERLLVQAERGIDVQAYLREWLSAVKLSNKVRIAVDVDPVSFF